MTTLQHSQATLPATPMKAKGRMDQLLSPVSGMKTQEAKEDVKLDDNSSHAVTNTAVHPASLPPGTDLVLFSVPLDINTTGLEGTQMEFPSDSLVSGHLGNAVEVTAVQSRADTGIHVLGIRDGVPSTAKVAAVYSLQYSLEEVDPEEHAIDHEALEALRIEAQEMPKGSEAGTEVEHSKKKKKKRKREKDEGTGEQEADHTAMDANTLPTTATPQQDTEVCEATEATTSIKEKQKKAKKDKKRKHVKEERKSHPVDAPTPHEAACEVTPKKKKKKKKEA